MDSSDTAKTYREGFVEGAAALLKAIGDNLPDEQKRVLSSWVSGPLTEWSHSAEGDARPPLPLIDGA